MREFIEIKHLCDAMEESQDRYIVEHELTDNMKMWCEGRKSAWQSVKDYCVREILAQMDQEELDYLDKLRREQREI